MKISINTSGTITDTKLKVVDIAFKQLVEDFSQATIVTDKLKAPYYLRCEATKRSDKCCGDTSELLILDCDSSTDGGDPPALDDVCVVLEANSIDYIAHSTHSHTPQNPRYRVLIHCDYSRDTLETALEQIHRVLHDEGVMLANVTENSTWAQAWLAPSMADDQHFQHRHYIGGE